MSAEFDKIREDAHLWRARLDDGACSAGERAEFDRWMAADPRHAEAFAESEILWKALSTVDFDASLKGAAANERGSLAWLRERFGHRARYIAAAAAVVFAMVVYAPIVSLMSKPDPLVYETAIGQIQSFELDDGSTVTLGAKSRIDVVMTEIGREVQLRAGDAYFDVKTEKARPFIVTTGLAEVRVTGTSFDLQRQGDTLHVAVAEGTVEVFKPSDYARMIKAWLFNDKQGGDDGSEASVRLAALEAVKVSRSSGLANPKRIRATDLAVWRNGQLVYLHASLAEIIDDVNRYAAQPIEIAPDVRELKLSGTFNANDIEGLLATLEAALPVRLIRKGETRILVSTKST